MLQQTQVERVVPLFEAFVARWPGFADLAAAPLAEVVRAWKGLGYNSRAVRLHAWPGRSSSGTAARCRARPRRSRRCPASVPTPWPPSARSRSTGAVVALDTNLRRVFHRVRFGLEWPPIASAREVEGFGSELASEAGAGYALNSALMDLGASLCTARAPKCLLCPLQASCAAAPIDPAALARLATRHAPKRGPQATLAFEATTRYLRGRLVDRLRDVDGEAWMPVAGLAATGAALVPARAADEVDAVLAALVAAGLVERNADASAVRLRR